MASTPTINVCQVDEKAEAEPTLAERIKAFLPPHTHLTAFLPRGDGGGCSAFEATWSTDAGVWTIVYAGKRSPLANLIASIAPDPVEAPDPNVVVQGPNGRWAFPGNTSTDGIQEFLVTVGAITPPEGPINPEVMDLMTGAATASRQAPDPEQDIDRARKDVETDERVATDVIRGAQDRLADARRRAAHLRRAPSLLPRFKDKATDACFGSDPPRVALMVHVSDAAIIAAELLAEADERHRLNLAVARAGRL